MRYGGAPVQLHADKAYDIAGRPRCAAEESFPRTGANRLTDRSAVGHVNSRLWVSRGRVVSRRPTAHETTSVRVSDALPLCGAAFLQVAATVRGEVRRFDQAPLEVGMFG